MTIRNLDSLLRPRSVAVIGASPKPNSIGAIVMRNLVAGKFRGPVYPVNPHHREVAGMRAFGAVRDLPGAPDLAVICTPPKTIPGLIAELGERGTKAAAVLTAGLGQATDGQGGTLNQAMLDASRPHLLRILGPNSVGLLVPGIGLNASFAHAGALTGNLAFVSQSGALVTAVLDWANARRIGFSHFISVGDSTDVDFGDLIDYLGSDASTRAILLYIESIKAPRKFMSAARAAARNRPVIVVKGGRVPAGAKAAASHTGALAGADAVIDAAIRRAGMLRVDTLLDLFAAVETLAYPQRIDGDRLAIMTNGGGAGVLATDFAALGGAALAQLSAATVAYLDTILPPTWSRANPVDIIGDAPPERYVATLKALVEAPEIDAVLFMHAPTAIVDSEVIAAACIPVVKAARRKVLSCWLGDTAVARARAVFEGAGVPTFGTPEEAVRAFLQLVTYRRNQELLIETPPSIPAAFAPDVVGARQLAGEVIATGREVLTFPEAMRVLEAYAIPVVESRVATSVAAAAAAAKALGFPVALKILSPDVSHKSDVGGVALNLHTAEQVRRSAESMRKDLSHLRPDARCDGFILQKMLRRPSAHEVIAGATTDPDFGPVILFGSGGTAVEVVGDRAVALPPLNEPLARELVSRTRIARLLEGYRNTPRVDHEALYLTLIKISQLMVDIPEIVELDINPLLVDDQGVLALDARIKVARSSARGTDRLAIRPYPRELEEWVVWNGRRVALRPIRPDDEAQHRRFLESLDPEDIRMRFFQSRRALPHAELARMTQIDYGREMAFIAAAANAEGQPETLGVVRAVADPDNVEAELGIIVRSDLKGVGLGEVLLEKIVRYCRSAGTQELMGQVLRDNARMLALVKRNGFAITPSPEAGAVTIRLPLQGAKT
jgi:acetyltransferase